MRRQYCHDQIEKQDASKPSGAIEGFECPQVRCAVGPRSQREGEAFAPHSSVQSNSVDNTNNNLLSEQALEPVETVNNERDNEVAVIVGLESWKVLEW